MTTIPRRCFQRLNSLPRHGKARVCAAVFHSCHYSSTASSVDFDAIRTEMLSRPAKHIWDVMSPTNSHLLNIALADFIPPTCQPAHFVKAGVVHPAGRSYDQAGVRDARDVADELSLPEGHQLVYFPPQIRSSGMLPDGTDPFQSPGAPFVRRMWAGGSVEFGSNLPLNSSPALCVESIDEVTVKGLPGEEKIFVNVLRRYMDEVQFQQELKNPNGKEGSISEDRKGPVERRTLVFMRRRDSEEIKSGTLQVSPGKDRVVKGRLLSKSLPNFLLALLYYIHFKPWKL
ncbi:hypothetical protein MGN70_010709 [Eutypa lata]|nr:hypothetical protein MGN70_010709 [Eutypa lata]